MSASFRLAWLGWSFLICSACSTAPADSDRRITGTLSYAERIALPPDAQSVVELRDEASGRVLAEQRQDLRGRQVPIAFVLAVDPASISATGRYSVRGLVQARDPQLLWLTEPKPVDPRTLPQDVGELRLVRAQRPPAFASTIDCGGRKLLFGVRGHQMRLEEQPPGDRGWTMQAQPTASGERYVAVDDPGTWLWAKGSRAQVSLGGQPFQECEVRHGEP